MTEKEKTLIPVLDIELHEELQASFLDYAVSVVISRAIPDVRDGLKPVHRRVLYGMNQLGFFYNKSYHKSVGVVGEVLRKYHPHGDNALYQTMVGMVQPFSKRYPLLDGQGNWGSVDGDNAAAYRYTEVKMQKICQEILADINKETVPFVPNFDESTVEPVVLPSKIPNLLINGTSGIAVGMATSIPPHNIKEILTACIELVKNRDLTDEDLFNYVKGPDFPTGGIVLGRSGIFKAYKEGRGSFVIRGVASIEKTGKGEAIIISELPYQVIKADLIEKIAHLVKDKIIEGISTIRDESNKEGMRIYIELKRDACSSTIINLLYKHTSLQTTFSVINLALLNNKPQLFTLKGSLIAFIDHRKEIITRRTLYDREKARAQEHLLEGLEKITKNAEDAIKIITRSENSEMAAEHLKGMYNLTDLQVKAFLDLKIQKMTTLERKNIANERAELLEKIKSLNVILDNEEKLKEEIIKEFDELLELYGDERRTVISNEVLSDFDESAFISDDEVVLTLTKRGYLKRVLLTNYELQRRGGKGKMGTADLDDSGDIIQDLFITKNHDEILFFTNLGRIYSKFVYEIPEAGRTAKGRAIVNLLPLGENETIVKLLCARDLKGFFITMITKKGTCKRVKADEFMKIRQTGIRAINLNEDDELAFCALTTGKDTLIVATKKGTGIRFLEKEIRVMGRQATGVRAIKLNKENEVIGVQVVQSNEQRILFVTENGFGKQVKAGDFRVAHRGGLGVRTIPVSGRNGDVIGMVSLDDDSDIMLIDSNGKIIRISPKEIRVLGRQAKGVRLIRLDETQKLSCVAAIDIGNDAEKAEQRKTELKEEIIIEDQTISDSENFEDIQEEINE